MGELGILIPLIGVSIPLVVVAGKFIVQPIVQAITRMHDSQQVAIQDTAPLLNRLTATEERLDRLEKSLHRIAEEQDFQRKLLSSRPGRPEAVRPEKAGS
ncbi:MAG: hypothetical protein L0271_22685 [Gemmatimonadetes bacterium]|nr:hypothetical protein [Gemmatimonadota bacterium]